MVNPTYISGAYSFFVGTHIETVDFLNSSHTPMGKIVSCEVSGAQVLTIVNIGGRGRTFI